MPSASYSLNSVSASTPLPVTNDMLTLQFLPFSTLCFVSAGATLTYSIEVTGDPVGNAGYVASSGNWFPLDSMNGLTASANAALGGCITAIRARITAYTSGTLTAQFIWAGTPR